MRVAVINQKGGVGKTCTAVHLAGAFAEAGRSTLLVDCDSQADASRVFDAEDSRHGLADLFAGHRRAAELVLPTQYDRLEVMPGGARLNAVDATHAYHESPSAGLLADQLAELPHQVILLDCPPRAHLTSYAALVAADVALVPVEPSEPALRSLARLLEEIGRARRRLNPGLQVCCFLSMFRQRLRMHQVYRELLLETVGEDMVLSTAIPELAAYSLALGAGRPITTHQPKGKAAQQVRAMVAEIERFYSKNYSEGPRGQDNQRAVG